MQAGAGPKFRIATPLFIIGCCRPLDGANEHREIRAAFTRTHESIDLLFHYRACGQRQTRLLRKFERYTEVLVIKSGVNAAAKIPRNHALSEKVQHAAR